MAEIIPPANPLVPLAAPPDRPNYRGRDERPPHWLQRQRSFQQELSESRAAVSYTRDSAGTHVRAARLDDDGLMSALVVDVERSPAGPRTTVALIRERPRPAGTPPGPLLQPGRLVDIVI